MQFGLLERSFLEDDFWALYLRDSTVISPGSLGVSSEHRRFVSKAQPGAHPFTPNLKIPTIIKLTTGNRQVTSPAIKK